MPAYSEKSFYGNTDDKINAGAKRDPVEGIVNIWKHVQQVDGIEITKAVSNSIEHGKENVETKQFIRFYFK